MCTGNIPIVITKSTRKEVHLKTIGHLELGNDFSSTVEQGPRRIIVKADSKVLKK